MKNKILLPFLLLATQYIADAQIPDTIISREEAIRRQMAHEQRWLIAAKGGFSYRVASLPKGLNTFEKEYYSDLKSGYFYEFSVSYYLKNGVGFGAFYEAFKSKNEIKNVTVTFTNGFIGTGTVSDDITISFFGPVFNYRLYNKNRNGFMNLRLCIGPMLYENNATVINPYKITGSTVGIGLGGSYYIGLSPEIWFGLHLGYNAGNLTGYDFDDGTTVTHYELPENQPEGLQHLNMGVTASFAF